MLTFLILLCFFYLIINLNSIDSIDFLYIMGNICSVYCHFWSIVSPSTLNLWQLILFFLFYNLPFVVWWSFGRPFFVVFVIYGLQHCKGDCWSLVAISLSLYIPLSFRFSPPMLCWRSVCSHMSPMAMIFWLLVHRSLCRITFGRSWCWVILMSGFG